MTSRRQALYDTGLGMLAAAGWICVCALVVVCAAVYAPICLARRLCGYRSRFVDWWTTPANPADIL